ncbi:MAG: hypothetical protein ABGY95_06855 [Rubritalea sp.]|uniref:hypothetical protein n=1 Tax=Rubritalea sp. TaxID=2109375 RepID=UPI003242DA0C
MSKEIIKSHFLRDLAEGIQQQMFFWGQDVLRPEGNFLVEQGFERHPSRGLRGTSCYRKDWLGGKIELYGSCAGWYGAGGGFSFIRPKRKCVIWSSSEITPIPGVWQNVLINKQVTREELYLASLPFLDWLIFYERVVLDCFGSSYREANYGFYKKVPKAKAWLEPAKALEWFECFRGTPDQLVRPKQFSKEVYV